MMENEKIRELLQRIESGYSLPTLSPVALKLVELASDEKSSATDLVRLIEKDPSLAVRLLKLANSAFFSSIHEITTLNQAVIKIGFRRLRIMALSISLRDTFPMGRVGPLNYAKFWRTSLYRALIARYLADHIAGIDPEEAFISGLILEIGLLIFFDLFVKEKDEDVSFDLDSLEDLLELERNRYGLDHRQVGEAAMRHWNFPEGMIACQRLYLRRAEEPDTPLLVKLCELARSLSGILFLESKGFQSIYREAERYLGLDQESINEALFGVFHQVEEIAENLSVDVDREKDLMIIMEKANKALGQISEKISKGKEPLQDESPPSFDSLPKDGEIVTHTLQAVAHEIRNPLLAVGGFARRLSASMEPSSKGGKYAQIILEEAERLEKVLSEMTKEEIVGFFDDFDGNMTP